MRPARSFATDGAQGLALAAFLKERSGESWRTVKAWLEAGRIRVNGESERDAGRRLRGGETIELLDHAPRVGRRAEVRIVHDDTHVVVIEKPEGVMSVPYEGERDTAMDLIRDAWRRRGQVSTPLLIVHRIDKDTSGLLVFAKSKRAEVELAGMFRAHSVQRSYLCVAHGLVSARRIESRLVPDRGDGLRGSARLPDQGKVAITHVRPLESLRRTGPGASLCEVRLETGKTHQIRIHLAESGHPLVGETVYIRDFLKQGGQPLPSPRLLLHAQSLGFRHPISGEPLAFRSEPPEDFHAALEALRRA